MVSDKILINFDPNKDIRLACDSSQYEIGTVLLYIMPEGIKQPICYILRVLGKKFETICDHKLLGALFGEYKSLLKMVAIKHLNEGENVKADVLSMLPVSMKYESEISDENAPDFDYLNFVEEVIPVDI